MMMNQRDDRNSPGMVIATIVLVTMIAVISAISLAINLHTGG